LLPFKIRRKTAIFRPISFGTAIVIAGHRRRLGVGTINATEGDQMTDLKQEARMLTLGERMILAARLAALEHVRQSVSPVPRAMPSFESNESAGGDLSGVDSLTRRDRAFASRVGAP
jgi:hypothetical protein